MNFDDIDLETMKIGGSNFNFSAVKPDDLEESEYTIVNLLIDTSGSVSPFSSDLDNMLVEVIKACKKSPKSDNLLLRLVTFNSTYREIHGYIPVNSIDEKSYKPLRCGGLTTLIDATVSAIGSTREYAKSLDNQDIMANGITFIITDGMDNQSSYTENRLKEEVQKLYAEEILDSFTSILIGVNTTSDPSIAQYLESFKNKAGIDQYIDMGDVTTSKLAKLGGFISKSISSQSQSLGTNTAASVSLSF